MTMAKEQQILIRLLGLNDTDKSWLAIFSEIASLLDSVVMDCDGNPLTQSDFDAVMSSLAATRDKARSHEVLASDGSVLDQETFDGIMRVMRGAIDEANEKIGRKEAERDSVISHAAERLADCSDKDEEIASLKAELAKHTWRPVSEYDKHVGVGVIALLRVPDDAWRRAVVGWRDRSSNWHYHDAPTQEQPTHFAHLPMDSK